MAGAKQWRVPCPHLGERPPETCMASEVSDNNKDHWRREDRVPDGVDASDLGDLLDRASGRVVVCNSCRRVMVLDGSGGIASVEFGPDPYADRWTYPGDPISGATTDGGRSP